MNSREFSHELMCDEVIYKTLGLKELLHTCEKIKSCRNLLDRLKNDRPVGANYNCNIQKWNLNDSLGREFGVYKNLNTFNDYNYESWFFCCTGNRKKKFTKTSLTFEEHINIRLLNDGCKLTVSENQHHIILKLYELKNEYENKSEKNILKKTNI